MHFKRSWKNQSLTDQVEPSVLLFCKINLQKTAGQTSNAITNTIDNLYTGQQPFNVSYVSLVSYCLHRNVLATLFKLLLQHTCTSNRQWHELITFRTYKSYSNLECLLFSNYVVYVF